MPENPWVCVPQGLGLYNLLETLLFGVLGMHMYYPHAIESTDKWFNMRMYLFSKEHREGLDSTVSFVSLLSELTRSFLFDHSELYVMSNLKKYKRMHSSGVQMSKLASVSAITEIQEF